MKKIIHIVSIIIIIFDFIYIIFFTQSVGFFGIGGIVNILFVYIPLLIANLLIFFYMKFKERNLILLIVMLMVTYILLMYNLAENRHWHEIIKLSREYYFKN